MTSEIKFEALSQELDEKEMGKHRQKTLMKERDIVMIYERACSANVREMGK